MNSYFLKPKTCNLKAASGFTLIELLVVIGIIGLLSTIVVATLSNVRENARLTGAKHAASTFDHDIGSEAVGWWDFGECSGSTTLNSADRVSSTLAGGVSWSTNVPTGSGCSLLFNGVNGSVSSPNMSATNFVKTDAFTVSGWIYNNAVPTNWSGNTLSSNINCSDSYKGWNVVYDQYQRVVGAVAYYNGSWRTLQVISANTYPVQKWMHIAYVNTGVAGEQKIYIDGVNNTGALTNDTSSFSYSGAQPVAIGKRGSCNDSYMNGIIDGVRVYSSSLTISQIQKLYAEGKPAHQNALAVGN